MDRVQNYNLQTPLTADDLNKQRDYTLIALGKMVSAFLGTNTVAEGLAATAVASTTVPTVQLADGQVYQLETVDPTAFGSLPSTAFPSTQQVMKQGLLLSARGDINTFQLTPPGTSGNSVIYLLEAQYADLDTDIQSITLYNVSNPSSPTTATEPRVREGTINFALKAGTAAASPVAPTADAGYVPLYAIEVAYGQTVLSQSNITVASGAPFLTQKLFGLMNESAPITIAPATTSNQAVNLWQFPFSAGENETNGYVKFPNGIILQWGFLSTNGSSSGQTITYPITFPNAMIISSANDQRSGMNTGSLVNLSTSQGTLYGGSSSGTYTATAVGWMAIGW